MPIYQVGDKEISVDTYQTPWPLSVVYKRQGIEVQVNPSRHWWCLWLCTTTDNADEIDCSIVLSGKLAPNQGIRDSCSNCGNLTVESSASFGFSQPWLYGAVEYEVTIRIGSAAGQFAGSLVFP